MSETVSRTNRCIRFFIWKDWQAAKVVWITVQLNLPLKLVCTRLQSVAHLSLLIVTNINVVFAWEVQATSLAAPKRLVLNAFVGSPEIDPAKTVHDNMVDSYPGKT